MIQRASVQPKPIGMIAPRLFDHPLEEPCSQPLPMIVGHQAELNQFDFISLAAVQLGKPCWGSLHMEYKHFIQRVVNDRRQFLIGEFSATEPAVLFPHGVIEKPVIRHTRPLGVNDRQTLPWGWHSSLRRGQHFKVIDGDVKKFQESFPVLVDQPAP